MTISPKPKPKDGCGAHARVIGPRELIERVVEATGRMRGQYEVLSAAVV